MDISIRGRNVEVPDTLRATVFEKVSRLGRLLDGMERAEVHFSEQRNPKIAGQGVCEVTLHGYGHILRGRAAAPEFDAAVDRVIAKLEPRMERLKGKLSGRSHGRWRGSVDCAQDQAVPGLGLPGSGQDPEPDGAAKIVKTKAFDITPMTPEEAALQMELLGHDFFFFTNIETTRAAVVYRRHDGHVGLIDAAG
jgi:putative sigma-54 modulation protein